MSGWQKNYNKEYASIESDRKDYPEGSATCKGILKFWDFLSFMFLISGFVAMALIFSRMLHLYTLRVYSLLAILFHHLMEIDTTYGQKQWRKI